MSRRLLIIIGVVVVVILAVGGFGVAYAVSQQNQTSTSNVTATTTPGTNPSSKNTAKSNTTRTVVGVIQSLNTQNFVITIERRKRTLNVTVSDTTKYATLEGQASFSDLKVGQTVQVNGPVDAQAKTLTALRVVLLPPLGQVATINGQALTLTVMSDGSMVKVNTSSSTLVYVEFAGHPVPISVKAIEVNQTLGYEGTTASDGSVSAAKLWILGLPQVRGTVTAISGNVLTLQSLQGATITVNLGANTTYIQGTKSVVSGTLITTNAQAIKVGSKVDVVADSKLASGSATAVLVIVA